MADIQVRPPNLVAVEISDGCFPKYYVEMLILITGWRYASLCLEIQVDFDAKYFKINLVSVIIHIRRIAYTCTPN